jgi:hypothetical protein
MDTYEIIKPLKFFRAFPNLNVNIESSSRATRVYNCIAYALDFENCCWWPHKDTYWPPDCPKEATLESFVCAFAKQGYEPCKDGNLQKSYEKIALYADTNGPTHAAKQLSNGQWTSKCGQNVDIEHELRELEGPCYGRIVMFFRRPIQS